MAKINFLKALFCLCIMLSCGSFAGCGGEKDSGEGIQNSGQAGQDSLPGDSGQAKDKLPGDGVLEGYYDLLAEQETVFQWEQEKAGSPLAVQGSKFIGLQFYRGEPVQLWLVPGYLGRRYVLNLCLYRQDGSREVIVEGIDVSKPYRGYLDQEGNLYWWHNTLYTGGKEVKTEDAVLKKYGASGEMLFEKALEPGLDIVDFCQAADGRLYLVVRGTDTMDRWLAGLDPATGLLTKLCGGQPIATEDLDLGVYGDKPVAWFGKGILEIGADGGMGQEILSMQGTSYMYPEKYRTLQDFRVLEDGSAEVLWAVSDGSGSLWEKLRMARVEKIPVTLRGWGTGGWLAKQINSFNRQSETYHVLLEQPAEDRADLARLTSVELASGKGPDILMGSLMEDYILGMLEKGALEDLRPFMERSGIREEDYFPYVFGVWRQGDGIYSVNPATPRLYGYLLDSSVLGGTEEPGIEALVQALLTRPASQDGEVFLPGYDSRELLGLLLKGTDTLWGMVDWEKGSCDFNVELFARMLEAARRYGDNGDGQDKPCIARLRNLGDIFHFDSREDREREGRVICGMLFDDGCHAAALNSVTLAVNSSSANKEGAWEFISFLLGDEAQSGGVEVSHASRRAFDIWVGRQREQVADGREIYEMVRGTTRLPDGSWEIKEIHTYSEADLSEERVRQYLEMLEDARTYPIRTAPILAVISEESEAYFNGSKSAEEVARLVTNRVQTYLDEGR